MIVILRLLNITSKICDRDIAFGCDKKTTRVVPGILENNSRHLQRGSLYKQANTFYLPQQF